MNTNWNLPSVVTKYEPKLQTDLVKQIISCSVGPNRQASEDLKNFNIIFSNRLSNVKDMKFANGQSFSTKLIQPQYGDAIYGARKRYNKMLENPVRNGNFEILKIAKSVKILEEDICGPDPCDKNFRESCKILGECLRSIEIFHAKKDFYCSGDYKVLAEKCHALILNLVYIAQQRLPPVGTKASFNYLINRLVHAVLSQTTVSRPQNHYDAEHGSSTA